MKRLLPPRPEPMKPSTISGSHSVLPWIIMGIVLFIAVFVAVWF